MTGGHPEIRRRIPVVDPFDEAGIFLAEPVIPLGGRVLTKNSLDHDLPVSLSTSNWLWIFARSGSVLIRSITASMGNDTTSDSSSASMFSGAFP